MRFENKFFGAKLDPTRDEAKYGCRTLMSGGKWTVPEDQRPAVAPAPEGLKESQYKADEILAQIHSERNKAEYGAMTAALARGKIGNFGGGGFGAGMYVRKRP